MLGINCLLRNRDIQRSLKDIIEVAGYELAAKTGEAKIKDVYNVVRKAGIEMDIQTLSYLYQDTFDISDPAFSSLEEIEDAREETFRRIANKESQQLTQAIGKNKPTVSAAVSLINSVVKNITDKTQQKIMEDRLIKAAKRILGIKNTTIQKSFDEILNEVISTERNNDFNGFGEMENAQELFRELAEELEKGGVTYDNAQLQQWGDILKNSTLDFLASTGEIKKLVDETLKESGYTREINTNNGKRSVVDWDKVIAENVDFRSALKSLFVKKGISDTNADNIVSGLEKNYSETLANKIQSKLDLKNKNAKDPRKTVQKKNIDRLLELYNLGIFDNSRQDALAKMMGVGQLKQDQLQEIRQIMSSYQTMMNAVPMAKWSPTVIRTFQRQIESLIQSFENKELAVSVMSKIASYMQWSNAMILVNPQNIAENIISGAIEANVVTGAINPQGFNEGLSNFWNKFIDFVQGGVRVGEEKANAFNRGGNLEDIYNRETKGMKRADVVASLIPRVALSAADNGFKHQIVQSLIQKTLRQTLMSQGATQREANLILNKIYYGNNEQIEDVARVLSGALVSAGVNTSSSTSGKLNVKEDVIASELALANMQSEGKFFQDTLNDLISSGELSDALKNKLNISPELLQTIRNAAYATASKGLGHEADNELLKLFETRYDTLNRSIEEAKKNGDYGEYALMTSIKLVWSGINKFRSGGFNWLFLSLQKSSGISLLSTLLTDVAAGKKRGIPLKFSQIDLNDTDKLEDKLSRYMALRQRLVRETIPVIFSYAIAGAALAYIKGGGDDEEKKKRLREFKIYLDNHPAAKRWANKLSPGLLYTYLSNINSIQPEKLPGIDDGEVIKLRDNGIYDINHENLSEVQKLLGINPRELKKISDKIDEENAKELPSLLGAYINPSYQMEAQKNNIQPNPAIQWGIDMVDKTKPDKGASTGQLIGNVLNLGGVAKSYDIWKNSFTNPEKIPGEYKIIKPKTWWEGFLFNTINRDIYKRIISDSHYELKWDDLPSIGSKGQQKLEDAGFKEVKKGNLGAASSILKLSPKQLLDINNYLDNYENLIKRIKK